jgi:hypothetical protein
MEQEFTSHKINRVGGTSWKQRVYFVFSIVVLWLFLLGWPILVLVWSAILVGRQHVYCDENLADLVIVSAGLWLLLGFYSLVLFFFMWLWGDIPHPSVVSSIGFLLLLCNFGYWIYLQVRCFESAGPKAVCPRDCSCPGYPTQTACCDPVVYGLTLAMIVIMYICALLLFCYPCWVSLVWSRRARRGLGRLGQWIGTASDFVVHRRNLQGWNRWTPHGRHYPPLLLLQSSTTTDDNPMDNNNYTRDDDTHGRG